MTVTGKCDIVIITGKLEYFNNDLNYKSKMNPGLVNTLAKPSSRDWISGESYIQACLNTVITNKFPDNHYILTLEDHTEEQIHNIMSSCKIAILPGYTKNLHKDHVLYRYSKKIYSYTYQKTNFSNSLVAYDELNSDGYPIYCFPLTMDKPSCSFDKNIRGMILGKCLSHTINRADFTLSLLDLLKNQIYCSYRDLSKLDKFPDYLDQSRKDSYISYCSRIIDHKNVNHLGIIQPNNFRELLRHCKYMIGFGNPRKTPTMMEALCECNCIILAPSSQTSKDLVSNKNYYNIDGMSPTEIADLIDKIEMGDIVFDPTAIPQNYTIENMAMRISDLINNSYDK